MCFGGSSVQVLPTRPYLTTHIKVSKSYKYSQNLLLLFNASVQTNFRCSIFAMISPFKENKYSNWYFAIIEKAKTRTRDETYVEVHHIVPKSLGGTNTKLNLVELTAREHFVCHWLLTKIVEDPKDRSKMYAALRYMRAKSSKHSERYFPSASSRLYDLLKTRINESLRGEFAPRWGKPNSATTRAKIGLANRGKLVDTSVRCKIAETLRSVSARRWLISFEDGKTEEVFNLKAWCKDRNVILTSLKNTMRYGTFYEGMKVSRME